MRKGFWDTLPRPFFILAPMADVTDAAFRRVIAKYSRMGQKGSKLGALYTEFVSADGLFMADEEGRAKLMRDLVYTEAERPIVAQFFSAKPEMMRRAAALAVELGFDGVDVNMGCPDRSVLRQGAGAALIKTPELAQELVAAAKEGVEFASAGGRTAVPVSVKTRIGYHKNELEEWLSALLAARPAAITLHLRTRREMSKVPAHWELASRAVALRDRAGTETLIVGNGDVRSLADAQQKVRDTGVDGAMLGKAIFGNPWLFSNRELSNKEISNRGFADDSVYDISYKSEAETNTMIYHSEHIPVAQRLAVMVEHTKLFEELLGDAPGRPGKSFAVMKKHYKAYLSGWPGAKELRTKLMEARDAREVEEIVVSYTKEEALAMV